MFLTRISIYLYFFVAIFVALSVVTSNDSYGDFIIKPADVLKVEIGKEAIFNWQYNAPGSPLVLEKWCKLDPSLERCTTNTLMTRTPGSRAPIVHQSNTEYASRTIGQAPLTMKIRDIRLSDEGTFEFSAIFQNGVTFFDRVRLMVLVKPIINMKTTGNRIVTEGQKLRFECDVGTGNPKPFTIEWWHNNLMLSSTKSNFQAPLIFNATLRKDSGIYRCIAKNDAGQDSYDINLSVQYRAEQMNFTINSNSSVAYAIIGSKVIMTCSAESSPPANFRIGFQGSPTAKAIGTTFIIEAAKITDSGIYECSASNGIGLPVAKLARLIVVAPLVLYGMSPSILSREGNSANLTCTASARPAPTITWHYNSAAINATISTTTVNETISTVTSVLKISSLTASANGQQVTCSATHHPYSPTINRTTTFNVQWIPDFIARPPITLAVNEGTNLQLQVTMGGNPKPSADFRWLHLTGSSSSNVQSVQLYPFVYSSTYTLNNIDASYCGRILQTSLKNSIGSLSDTASTNVTVLLNLDIDFGLKAGRIGGAKCVEVKWNKVEAGACYVNYEVVLKNASGSNEYSNSGYNIGMMTMCSFLTFSSVTDVQLTVSFKSTSRNISAKVSDTPLTTPTPTPTDTTYRSSSGVINTQTAEINIKETTRTAQPTSCVNNSGCNQASSDEWKSRDSAVLAVIVILIIMLIMLSVIIILMRRRLNSAISRKQTRQAGQAEIHYIDLGIPSREAESNNAKLQGEYGEVGRKNPQYVNM